MNSMEQRPCWEEVNDLSSSQYTVNILQHPTVQYRVRNLPTLYHVLSEMNVCIDTPFLSDPV